MTTTLELVPLTKLHDHPSNPRKDLGDLAELADSIRVHGILEPLIVGPHPKGYVLIAGHRRRAAAKLAGQKTVPCIVRADLDDDASQLSAMLVENLQRSDLTPVEEAHAYEQMLAFPEWNVGRIAKATGRAERTVKLRLGLARLPEKVLDKVQARQIPLDQAEVLAAFAKKPDQLKQLERAAGTPNFAWTVERIRADERHARAVAGVKRDLAKARVAIVQGYSWQQQLTNLGIEVADHASCEGHAAALPGYGTQPIYLCTDPVKYGHRKDQATPAESRAAAGYGHDDPEHQQRLTDREAAAKVRDDFLRGVLAKPTARTFDALVPVLVHMMVREWYFTDDVRDLELLGVDVPEDADDQWVLDETSTWPHTRVLAWLVGAAALGAQPPAAWMNGSARYAVYLAALESLGYEPSDVDRSLLPAGGDDD